VVEVDLVVVALELEVQVAEEQLLHQQEAQEQPTQVVAVVDLK
jgi:hypothetical protein